MSEKLKQFISISYIMPLSIIILLVYTRFNSNFLVFYSFAEFFAICVSLCISLVTYYTYSFTKNRYLLFLGIGYFWVAIFAMMHIQTFPGMKLYNIENSDVTLTFWILSRLFEAVMLLIAPFIRDVKYKFYQVSVLFAIISFIIIIISFKFPLELYDKTDGLTSLKIIFESVIISILLIALYINKLRKKEFCRGINEAVKYSIILTVLAEISFTMYSDFYGVIILIGHIFKFLSFWILLQAIIKTSFQEPFSLMKKGFITYNSIPYAAVLVDESGIIKQANAAACATLKMNVSDIIGRKNHTLYHPDDIEEGSCPICKSITKGKVLNEYELEDVTNENIKEYSLSPTYSNNVSGKAFKGMVQVSIDITKRKKLESSLVEQYGLIQNIIDTVPVRIFWKDKKGVYLGANKLFLKDANLSSTDELVGKTDFDMVWGKYNGQMYRDDDLLVMKHGKAKLNFEEMQTHDKDVIIDVITSKIPLKSTKGKIIGVLGCYQDITQTKELEKKNRYQEQQLLQQSRLAQMGEMISMIAHQWRQPLTAISTTSINLKMQLELEVFDLSTKEGQDEQNNFLNQELNLIEDFVQNLTVTIDDFRNFYKPNKKRTMSSLEGVCKKALNIIKASLSSNNIEIQHNYKSKEKLAIYPNEIMQVVLNIFKNAQDNFIEEKIKKPKIIITTTKNFIEICDNGGGIEKDIIDKIFDPYFSTKSEKNGSGLGLYMSKIIIEDHHNAKFYAKNKGDGVCFTIKFL